MRPGLVSMAQDAAASLADGVPARAGGASAGARPETVAARKAACASCPSLDPETGGCQSCGCGQLAAARQLGVDLDLKQRLAALRCPQDPPRWLPEDTLK